MEFIIVLIFLLLAIISIVGTIVLAISLRVKIDREEGKINLIYTKYFPNFTLCCKSINCKILKRKH